MARRRKNSSVTIAREDLAALNGHGGSANGVAGGSGQINAGLVSVSAESREMPVCTSARDGYGRSCKCDSGGMTQDTRREHTANHGPCCSSYYQSLQMDLR